MPGFVWLTVVVFLFGSSASDSKSDGGTTAAQCTMKDTTGPVVVTEDGAVVENLRIRYNGTAAALTVTSASNVVLRNLAIEHSANGPGIAFGNADNLLIENVTVELVDSSVPPTGPLPSSNAVGISGQSSQSVRITRVRLVGGSAGIYLNLCRAPTLTFIEGHDARGPFPRGQCVQFDKCANALLQDFSCVNNIGTPGVTNSSGSTSWTEDNISIFQSNNATIRRGLIDGNNSPSGDGVMFESGGSAAHGITHGLVEDVTVTNQGNGCFGAWGVSNIVFKDVQVSHTHCNWTDGRSPPSSGALVFGAGAEGTPPIQSAGIQIVNATYNTLCKQNLFWPGSAFSKMDAVEGAFAPREPLHLQFCFDE